MKHGRSVVWSAGRRHVFADGSSLQLEVEREPHRWLGGPGHTRAVLRDDDGHEIDATEWFADPGARMRSTMERLRVLVDEYLAQRRNVEAGSFAKKPAHKNDPLHNN
jgi:hypothetical protein